MFGLCSVLVENLEYLLDAQKNVLFDYFSCV